MKKVLVLLSVLLMFSFGFGADGWYSDYILINGESAPDNYYWIGSDPGYVGSTGLDGHDFGTVSSLLTINGCDLKYWTEATDRVGGAFYWRINTGTATEVIWDQTALGGNDYQGTLSGLNIDVLSGLTPGQTYELQIWAKSWGGYDMWLNNSGANYVATFTVATDGEVPVTLASFTAEALKGKVELAWVTESETENSHFLVYRDGEVIAQVDGAGTTSETNEYAYSDVNVLPGVHEYALADVTYGGVEELHDAVTVELGATVEAAEFTLNSAYPNPFNPDTRIEYCMNRSINLNLGVYNLQGEKVANLFDGVQEAGAHTAIWNATGFPSGIYVVRMMSEGMLQTMKVVLMK